MAVQIGVGNLGGVSHQCPAPYLSRIFCLIIFRVGNGIKLLPETRLSKVFPWARAGAWFYCCRHSGYVHPHPWLPTDKLEEATSAWSRRGPIIHARAAFSQGGQGSYFQVYVLVFLNCNYECKLRRLCLSSRRGQVRWGSVKC